MAEPGGAATPPPVDKSVGELIIDVSERTSSLIREEIELAKTEVTEKVSKLVKGGVVGAVAGVFALLALILFMHGIAWLFADLIFGDRVWAGFFLEALLFLITAGVAGFLAYKSVMAGSPPVPEQAIEQAKLTKQTFEGPKSPGGSS